MKEKNIIKTNQKGITLIALVITIIVLLILAGVAISSMSGNGNIMQKAQDASNKTKEAEEESNLQLAVANLVASHAQDTLGKFTKGELQTELAKIGITSVANGEGATDTKGPWIVTGTVNPERTWTVTENGSVTRGGTATPTATPTSTPTPEAVISKSTSYVGKYADINGDDVIDGIIYVDLLNTSKTGGTWNPSGNTSYDSNGTYTITTDVTSSNVKDYVISKTSQTDTRFDSTARDVIKLATTRNRNKR